MEKLKIAVLDSGFDFYRFLQNPIVYNACFTDEESYIDQNGHGSCIMSLLDSVGSNLEFYNMVVLDRNKLGRLSSLKRALSEAINQSVNIINLSLGIECDFTDPELEDILLRCNKKNIVLITTSSNSGMHNYLASHKNIFCIQGYGQCKAQIDSLYFQPGMFLINNMPRIVPWIYGSYKLSGANSFLTPFLIKKLYQINKECTSFDQCSSALLKLSGSDILKLPAESLCFSRSDQFDKLLHKEILSYPVISDLYDKSGKLLLEKVTNSNITQLVKLIEVLTKKTYTYDSVWLSDILFLENLVNKILFLSN